MPVGHPDWQPITAWSPRVHLDDQLVSYTTSVDLGPFETRQAPGVLVSVRPISGIHQVSIYPVTGGGLALASLLDFHVYSEQVTGWAPNVTGRVRVRLEGIGTGPFSAGVTLAEANVGGAPRILVHAFFAIVSQNNVPAGGYVQTNLDPPHTGQVQIGGSVSAGAAEGILYTDRHGPDAPLFRTYFRAARPQTWFVLLPPTRAFWRVVNVHSHSANLSAFMRALGVT
jgi:hypothetical protein